MLKNNLFTSLVHRFDRYLQKAWSLFWTFTTKWSQRKTIRLGSDYGGWTLCPDNIGAKSVIYSVGIGEDITFDLAVISTYGCPVFAFDPTPRSIEWLKKQELPSLFRSFGLGLAGYDGEATFFPPENPEFVSHTMLGRPETKSSAIIVPVKKLASIMRDLGHDRIDLLKMDIEGAEYDVIDDILSADLNVGQILVEFHHFISGIGIFRTIRSTIKLILTGYKLFAISKNGNEYSFIKKAS